MIGRRLMLLEATNGGRRLVSLSSYSNHEMVVVRLPIVDKNDVIETLFDRSGDVSYSYFDMILIGIKEFFNIKIRPRNDIDGEVCTELISDYINRSRFQGLMPTNISPGKQIQKLMSWNYFPIIEIKINK